MGIRGFKSFLKAQQNILEGSVFKDVQLSDEYLILDGSETFIWLLRSIENNYYGTYQLYQEKVYDFFSTLDMCGLKPIVLFDGMKYENDYKYYISKRCEKIKEMDKFFKQFKGQLLNIRPTMMDLVFKQILEELNIPFAIGEGDMDAQTQALVNMFDAYVVGTSSNYFARDLKKGFLDLENWKWDEIQVNRSSGQNYIAARVLIHEEFCQTFGITGEAFWFMATIFNNSSFEEHKILQNYFEGRVMREKIQHYFQWARYNYIGISDAVRTLGGRINIRDSTELANTIKVNIEKYRTPNINLGILNSLQETSNIDQQFYDILESNKNQAMLDSQLYYNDKTKLANKRKKSYPYREMGLLKGQERGIDGPFKVPLHLVLSPTNLPSPHSITKPIRLKRYAFVVLGDSIEIVEYDREDCNYVEKKTNKIQRSDSNLQHASTEEKQGQLAADILNPKNSKTFSCHVREIPDELKLLVLASMYWVEKAKPNDHMVRALATTVAMVSNKEDIKFTNARKKEYNFDVNDINASTQWQLCMAEVIGYNQLLDSPCRTTEIGKMFCGYMFLCIISKMMESNLLEGFSSAQCTYDQIYQVLKQC